METDIVVIGAGHAGCEAALIAARMNCSVLLVTINLDTIAQMPCNPSIGGPGKGIIVREIDAIGGEMAANTDETQIHIRMLNTSKGPAVQALRAQADKNGYHMRMKQVLETQNNIALNQNFVDDILVKGDSVSGILLSTGETIQCRAIIVTTGTFLKGIIHIGDKKFEAGRLGEFPSVKLSDSIGNLGFKMGRLKTGTVPRVNRRTIDFAKCRIIESSEKPLYFSDFSNRVKRKQVPCWQTYTSEKTKEVILRNIHKSALFSGQISGIGPRYCPSIEDKMNRFRERERHPIFIEPEGIDTEEIYLQGLSSSLPVDIQREYLSTIPGLERAEIMRPAYAIEYDFVYPTQLTRTLETKSIKGLFMAGQINGTSGYEEAAGQGVIAGINAALSCCGREPFSIYRSEGYIGVLIDDLITKGTEEPYRIFTALAEFRLLLRHDNADSRLSEKAWRAGALSQQKYDVIDEKLQKLNGLVKSAKMFHVKHGEKKGKSISDLLKEPGSTFQDMSGYGFETDDYTEELKQRAEIELKYEGYISKQLRQVEKFKKSEMMKIPQNLDYQGILGISNEAREKLSRHKPESIGMALRIPGVSPADITVLIYCIEGSRAGKSNGNT